MSGAVEGTRCQYYSGEDAEAVVVLLRLSRRIPCNGKKFQRGLATIILHGWILGIQRW